MAYVLTAALEGGEGFAIFIDRRPLVDFNSDGESDPMDFRPGEHSLTYEVRGAGAKLTLDLSDHPSIILPVGAEWPFEIKVPNHRTLVADRLYFTIGG